MLTLPYLKYKQFPFIVKKKVKPSIIKHIFRFTNALKFPTLIKREKLFVDSCFTYQEESGKLQLNIKHSY